ncbi:MAG: SAM-dependent methyltransferase [Actinomycetota bacterium]|nr:SAM-dependent methyltransferase [Actinomycetota bacterium]
MDGANIDDDRDRSLSSLDLRLYGRAGLDEEAGKDWRAAGIGGYEAEAWRRVGVELDEAEHWRAQTPAVSGGRYAQWLGQGLDPERAFAEWKSERKVRSGTAPTSPPPMAAGDEDHALARVTLNTREVSDLADVDPAVVTAWRSGRSGFKKGSDPGSKATSRPFPQPLSAGRSPTFDAREVVEWLRLHDRLAREPDPAWYWRQVVKALPTRVRSEEDRARIRAFVAAEVARRVIAPPEPQPAGGPTASEVKAAIVPRTLAELQTALDRALAAGDPLLEPVRLLEDALDALDSLSPAASATSPALARLMDAMAGPPANERVLDPACGEGELLLHLVKGASQDPLVEGIERDPDAAFIARTRCRLRHVPVNVRTADSLSPDAALDDRRYVTIVLDPPAGKRRSGHKEWIQLVRDHLADDGRGCVAVPTTALRSAGTAGAQIPEGAVEAVALLPSYIRTEARGPQVLCVLTRHTDNRHVLVIDLSRAANPGALRDKRPSTKVVVDPADDVRRLVADWRNSRSRSRLARRRRDHLLAAIVEPATLSAHLDHLLRTPKEPKAEPQQTDALTAARELLDLLKAEPDKDASLAVRAALEAFVNRG